MKPNTEESFRVFRNFIWKEMTVGNALVNGICNGVIYALLIHQTAPHGSYLISTLISNLILGIIVLNLYPYTMKLKLKKMPNIEIPYSRETHILASLYPKNGIAIRIINIAVCVGLSTVVTFGITGCLGIWEFDVVTGAIIRGVDCALFSMFAYYFSILFYTGK